MVFTNERLQHIEIPSKISYGEWLLQNLRRHAMDDKTVQVWADNGAEISYADLLRESVQAAAGLQKMGVRSGDKMSFVTRNSPEVYTLAFGCILSDVVVAPSVAESSANELRQNFVLIQPTFVLTRPEKIQDVQKALDCDEITSKPTIICLDEITYKEILLKGSHADAKTFRPAQIEDPSTHNLACLFSSGTTGKQKPIMLSDYELLRTLYRANYSFHKHTGLVMNTSQPHWISWLFTITRCIIAGRPLLFFNKADARDMVQAIHKFKPTLWYTSPPYIIGVLREMEENPGRWDINSLKLILCSSDLLSKSLHRELVEKSNIDIYQEYGSTEVGYVTVGDVDSSIVYGSAGKPIVPVKLVNIDTEEEITEPNQIGEVRVETAEMTEYYNNPEATAEIKDKNGWYKLGDLAYFSETNDLFVVERIKEMLKYKGFQIPPRELEEIIKSIPGVQDAAVAGKKDKEAGDIITAFVVKAPGAHLTENGILTAYAKENLHDSKKLRGGVIFVDELPKNSNGKLTRRKLADVLNGTSILRP